MKICLYDSGLGIASFLKIILKNNLCNDYYLYFDNKNFPFGNKSEEELKSILNNFFKKIKKYHFDYILICCNTMSNIFKKYHFNIKEKVINILDINLTDIDDRYLYCTYSLSKSLSEVKSLEGGLLPSFIEHNQIANIIKKIKTIDKNIILGCTHFHLLKELLDYFSVDYVSKEAKIFDGIPTSNQLNFYVKKKDYKLIKNYLKKDIIFY